MTPCHHSAGHFSDQELQILKNSRAHTEYLFQRGELTDLWQVVGNGIVSAHKRTQTLSSYFPTAFVSGLTTLYLFITPQVLLQGDGESLSVHSKNSYLTIFPNSHTSSGSNHSCSTEGVPAPPAYPPPPHHEDIKGTGKENQNPGCLGECLEQKEWMIGEHGWWWIV